MRGTYSDQLTEEVGEGAFDQDGHMNSQFLKTKTVGPYPGEMQKAWERLRSEAAANYGFQEGFGEDEARERMEPLAEHTPTGVRNRGASQRKRIRRVEAFVTEGHRTTEDFLGEEGETREDGNARRRQGEVDAS